MSAIKLHMLKPSVNNMSVRVFLRAGKLDFSRTMHGARRATTTSSPATPPT